MQTNLLCIISFFILLSPDLQFVHPQSQNRDPYQSCSATFNCGNITEIGYPFWGSNRPEYCGHPKFHLNCSNQTAKIKIQELNYRVLDINTNSKNLKVVREDYIGNICPEPHVNTTLDWKFLSYASDIHNITLYYGCPTSQSTNFTCNDSNGGLVVTRDLGNSSISYGCVTTTAPSTSPKRELTMFTCNDSSSGFVTRGNSTPISYVGSCTTKVLVPATESAIEPLGTLTVDNLVGALDQGFGLQWDVDNSICEACSLSGGVCGYNNSSFTCYNNNSSNQTRNQPQSGNKRLRTNVSIGVSIAFATLIASLGCYYCFTRKRGIVVICPMAGLLQ